MATDLFIALHLRLKKTHKITKWKKDFDKLNVYNIDEEKKIR